MERVAFLIEETGSQLRCMLNPESLVLKRHAGLMPSDYSTAGLSGNSNTSNALLFNGGGTTELDLDLLFDITLTSGSSPVSNDVRELTRPIWQLSENTQSNALSGSRPPIVRFVWGKTWNIRAVVHSVAERFESFGATGLPKRSWLRVKLLQLPQEGEGGRRQTPPRSGAMRSMNRTRAGVGAAGEEMIVHRTAEVGSGDENAVLERLDQLAEHYYGDTGLWRHIASANSIRDPGAIPPGTQVNIPPLPRN